MRARNQVRSSRVASSIAATFGKTTVGASSDSFRRDRKRVNRYLLPVSGAVTQADGLSGSDEDRRKAGHQGRALFRRRRQARSAPGGLRTACVHQRDAVLGSVSSITLSGHHAAVLMR